MAPEIRQLVQTIWPADSVTLVSRKEIDGVVESRFRIRKKDETRIVSFALAPDGKVASLGFGHDPDVR
jgi:hypothetical protein